MKRIFVSNYNANEAWAEPYANRIAAEDVALYLETGDPGDATVLKEADALLVFLGEGQNYRAVKQDVNLALDRKLPVFAVLSGEPAIDRGLEVQLGLATKVYDGEDGPEELAAAISAFAAEKPKKKKKTGLIIAIVVALLALVIVGFILFTQPNIPPVDPPDDVTQNIPEHIEMEEALLKGLTANGIDANGDGYIERHELTAYGTLLLKGYGITDVTPLAEAYGNEYGLIILDLSDNNITDVTPIASFSILEELDLSNNKITSCAPLLALKNLTKLDLSGNPLEDASNLAFMTWVTDLKYDGGTK